jgi:hypothetical protein
MLVLALTDSVPCHELLPGPRSPGWSAAVAQRCGTGVVDPDASHSWWLRTADTSTMLELRLFTSLASSTRSAISTPPLMWPRVHFYCAPTATCGAAVKVVPLLVVTATPFTNWAAEVNGRCRLHRSSRPG